MTPLSVILEALRKSEPTGIDKFDTHEEKLCKEKTKIWKEEIYSLFRPVVGPNLSGEGSAGKRRAFRLGLDAKEKEERLARQESKGTEVTSEKIMDTRPIDLQDDE